MKYKLALLLTVTMLMPTATTALAAETSTTATETTKTASEANTAETTESGVWQLTFEEALELAEENSSDLDNVAEKAEYLQDLKEALWKWLRKRRK